MRRTKPGDKERERARKMGKQSKKWGGITDREGRINRVRKREYNIDIIQHIVDIDGHLMALVK